ncbi:O-antigen ligase family protein [Heyndrickxia coagulans]|uniref:O-antigen ligase family protein n=1 Tax=Heyndrickxia coagulans TaxID=1398 RepID=UPI002E1F56A0|nr:O-antigen ligase family protein [Heyndrickxia coagulans]
MGEPLYSLHMSGSNLVLLMILLIENYINRVIYKMIIFTFFIIILVTGFSRTGLIIACCYGFITILKFFRNKKYKNKYKKVLIIYSTFIFLSATITSLIIILINNLHLQTASNVERTTLMQISWDMFKKSWIYGIGPDNFNTFLYNYKELLPYTSDESMKTLAPHNVFLENLVQFGIIGFFLFTIPLIYLLVKSYKNKSFRSDNLNLLLYVIILLVTSVISGNNRFLFSSILGYLFYQADYSYSNRRLQR